MGLAKTNLVKSWRGTLALLGVVMLLALTVDMAFHREHHSPNGHICKLCVIAITEVAAPADGVPAVTREADVIIPQTQERRSPVWSLSNPRSPPVA